MSCCVGSAGHAPPPVKSWPVYTLSSGEGEAEAAAEGEAVAEAVARRRRAPPAPPPSTTRAAFTLLPMSQPAKAPRSTVAAPLLALALAIETFWKRAIWNRAGLEGQLAGQEKFDESGKLTVKLGPEKTIPRRARSGWGPPTKGLATGESEASAVGEPEVLALAVTETEPEGLGVGESLATDEGEAEGCGVGEADGTL